MKLHWYTTMAVAMMMCVRGPDTRAQCHAGVQAMAADSTLRIVERRPMGYDTLGPGWIVPAYSFEYQCDSTRLVLDAHEFQLNSKWILLEDWCFQKTWNWSDAMDTDTNEVSNAVLSALSRTKTFALRGGDTVSMVRFIDWYDKLRDEITTEHYVNPDAITMTFEVVNAATNARVHLLDSIKFEPTTVSGKPCFYSPRPLFSRLMYIRPTTADSIDAFVRVNVASQGATARHWYRTDMMKMPRSYLVSQSPVMINYCNLAIANNECGPGAPGCGFMVGTVSSPKALAFTVPPGPITALHVYASSGALHGTIPVTPGVTSYNYPITTGLYFVVGSAGPTTVCTRAIGVD